MDIASRVPLHLICVCHRQHQMAQQVDYKCFVLNRYNILFIIATLRIDFGHQTLSPPALLNHFHLLL